MSGRFPDGDPPPTSRSTLPIMDDRQLDAVAALTSFAQVGFGAAARVPSGGDLYHQPPVPRPESLGRQFSNSSLLTSTNAEYPVPSAAADPRGNSYYTHGNGGRSTSGTFHGGPNVGEQPTYHRASPAEGDYRHSSGGSASSTGGYNVPITAATAVPPYLLPYRSAEQSHLDALSASQRSGGSDAGSGRRPSPPSGYYHQAGNADDSRSAHSGFRAQGYGDRMATGYSNGVPAAQSPHYSEQTPMGYQDTPEDMEEDDEEEVVAEAEEDDEDDDEEEGDDDVEEAQVVHVPPVARGKPEAIARAQAAARVEALEREALGSGPSESAKKKSPKKATSLKKNSPKKPANRKRLPQSMAPVSSLLTLGADRREFLLGERVPTITLAEYDNLQELMTQFCRVPLLSEFSRPVSVLHPELSPQYSKIISHPVDLGHVSRGIRRRSYKNCRDVRLDVWRVFANCVKYNSHPANKDTVPSFVSIALHLREYFNNLWQEYMLPSDPPTHQAGVTDKTNLAFLEVQKAAFARRDQERKKRLENSGVLVLSKTFTTKASSLLLEFIENGGRVDGMDAKPLFGPDSGVDSREVDLVIQRLGQYHAQLEEVAESGTDDYTLDAFHLGLSNCFTEHVLEDNPAMRNRFRCRLDRFFWKQAVPLHEANSRGVTQSSIWGNLAATIWARESSKKVFWPALCLGILPPAEQREGWHQAVTERNESRLPEKLRGQLLIAKKRCEQAQKRQSLSYFLVEFLGTHEFIWVRETDIIENFDPNNDPNKASAAAKKSRSSRSSASTVVGSKTYATALQECVWANEEYENVLQDAFENSAADNSDDDNDEVNCSFHTLAQSDEEADRIDRHGYNYEEDDMDASDIEEANYLIAHDGLLDMTASGRKNAKKRTQELKKKAIAKKEVPAAKKEDTVKKSRPKAKEKKDAGDVGRAKNPKEKERLDKREKRELEQRRKKRVREHEKSQRSESRKKTKRRGTAGNEGNLVLSHDKRSRATAIVKAYLARTAANDECRRLALNEVMTMPAALVDSSGLMGVTLAFRAATGDLPMPDDGRSQIAKVKPWMAVDSIKPKTSLERADCLQQQIRLLERDIARIRANTSRRKEIAAEYQAKRTATEANVQSDDAVARCNNFKKKKTSPTPSKPKPTDESKEVEEMAADDMESKVETAGLGSDPNENVAMDSEDKKELKSEELAEATEVKAGGELD